jgi:signal recognition particle receptor subunit beta
LEPNGIKATFWWQILCRGVHRVVLLLSTTCPVIDCGAAWSKMRTYQIRWGVRQ